MCSYHVVGCFCLAFAKMRVFVNINSYYNVVFLCSNVLVFFCSRFASGMFIFIVYRRHVRIINERSLLWVTFAKWRATEYIFVTFPFNISAALELFFLYLILCYILFVFAKILVSWIVYNKIHTITEFTNYIKQT